MSRFLPPQLRLITSAFFSLLALFALWRLVFLIYFLDDFQAENAWLYAQSFFVALRLDAAIGADLLFVPVIWAHLPVVGWPSRAFGRALPVYMAAVAALLSVLCSVDIEWFREFGIHLNALMLTYGAGRGEVYESIWEFYPVLTYAFFWVATAVFFFWWFRRCVRKLSGVASGGPISRLLTLPFILALLVVFARGGLQQRPANWGVAHFSTDNMANALAQNCAYFLGRSVIEYRNERDFSRTIDFSDEVLVRETLSDLRMRNQKERMDVFFASSSATPPNLMIIVLESFVAENCNFLNPYQEELVTPHLNELAARGVSFSRCYANGIRSAYGLSSLLGAWPVLPGKPMIAQIEASVAHNRAAPPLGILRDLGYELTFLYAGDSHFDNMRGFALTNGFSQVIDWTDPTLAAIEEGTAWGRFDHHLLARTIAAADQQTSPFFFTVFTTTNHEPFQMPEAYSSRLHSFTAGTRKYERAKTTMAYDDLIIDEFLAEARQHDWFDNTVFVFTADHGMTVHRDLANHPLNGHIPFLIYADDLVGGGVEIDKIVSQLDILPTLFDLIGQESRLAEMFGVSGLRGGSGFACRTSSGLVQWIEDGWVCNTFLGAQRQLLYQVEDIRALPYRLVDDNPEQLHLLRDRSQRYLSSAFLLYKGIHNNEVESIPTGELP